MEALLTFIVTWLSINFGLPAVHDLPQVKTVDDGQMLEVRAAALPEDEATKLREMAGDERQFYAVYDDTSATIFLKENWSPASPADVSVLVHEMVHHLQDADDFSGQCPEARERSAYRAQARWLELVGTTLEGEFGLDPMTVLVRTNCWN